MKIAIIGTGIAGTSISYLLHEKYDITVYEKNDYIGGHSRTINVNTPDGEVPVDTGFIVFNKRNYPHLTALFEHLDVPTTKSDMSFGVSINSGWLEYGSHYKLGGMFAQKKNLISPKFWGMLFDVLKFNKNAKQYIENDRDLTLGQTLDKLNLGFWFRDYYLLAMGASIWSTPRAQMLDFPASAFLRFFENHGLLTVTEHPQWYTVVGGSKEYVQRITAPYKDKVQTSKPVKSVTRSGDKVIVTDETGASEEYEHVILACHSDQALKLLQNPTDEEQKLLQSVKYIPNEMVLHTDTSFMPKNKKAWSSWIYLSEARKDDNPTVSLSYWMNNLQPLETETPIIVTLNPGKQPDPHLIQDRYTFHHPLFDSDAVAAQQSIEHIQGKDMISFCGAWQRYGFHEDGLLSSVNLAKTVFGIDPPWM